MCYSLPLFYSKSVGSHKLAQNHACFVTPKLLKSQALRNQKLTRQKSNPFLTLGFLQEPDNTCEQDTGQCFDSSRTETKAFSLPYCSAEFKLSCKDLLKAWIYVDHSAPTQVESYLENSSPRNISLKHLETRLVWSGSTVQVPQRWVWCSIPSICWEKQSCFPSTHLQPHHSCLYLWEQ